MQCNCHCSITDISISSRNHNFFFCNRKIKVVFVFSALPLSVFEGPCDLRGDRSDGARDPIHYSPPLRSPQCALGSSVLALGFLLRGGGQCCQVRQAEAALSWDWRALLPVPGTLPRARSGTVLHPGDEDEDAILAQTTRVHLCPLGSACLCCWDIWKHSLKSSREDGPLQAQTQVVCSQAPVVLALLPRAASHSPLLQTHLTFVKPPLIQSISRRVTRLHFLLATPSPFHF